MNNQTYVKEYYEEYGRTLGNTCRIPTIQDPEKIVIISSFIILFWFSKISDWLNILKLIVKLSFEFVLSCSPKDHERWILGKYSGKNIGVHSPQLLYQAINKSVFIGNLDCPFKWWTDKWFATTNSFRRQQTANLDRFTLLQNLTIEFLFIFYLIATIF